MNESVTVQIIEPMQNVRELLVSLLDCRPFVVRGIFPNVRAASAVQCSPNLLVVGLSSGFLDVSDIASLRRTYPYARIVVLSDRCDDDDRAEIIGLGSVAFLLKSMPPQALLSACILASTQDVITYSCRGNIRYASVSRLTKEDRRVQSVGLSPRETTILDLVKDGDSNKHIARKLGIAEATVKCHVKSILRKINVRNRFDAAMWALRASDEAGPQARQSRPLLRSRSASEGDDRRSWPAYGMR